jgi:RNA polymerase sigma-70 factor (ECF subfamily)
MQQFMINVRYREIHGIVSLLVYLNEMKYRSNSRRDTLTKSGAEQLTGSQLKAADDNTLVDQLAEGRDEALLELFKRHSPVVMRTARRILGNDSEAEEIVQQVFIEAYARSAQFDPQKGSFRSWLLVRTVSRAVSRKERLSAMNSADIDDEVGHTLFRKSAVSLGMFDQEVSYLARELVKKLPSRERKVITATFFEGMSAEEITRKGGQSLVVVRHLFYEGLRRLRSMLREDQANSRTRRE